MKKLKCLNAALLAAVLLLPAAVQAGQGEDASAPRAEQEGVQVVPEAAVPEVPAERVLLAAAADGGAFQAPAGGAETKEEPPPSAKPGPGEPVADAALEEDTIADPLEPWNRAMYHFNDKLYFWVLKPVAQGYNVVAPEPVRISVRNFFFNLTMPIRFVNSLLQGKVGAAGTELGRFGINTTVGIAGLFDVAQSAFDLSPQKEDFGQTLGFYGMPGVFYIVWPVLGPMTLRDTIGFAGDLFLDPVNYLGNPWISAGIHAYDRVNDTSLKLGQYEDLKKDAFEPYSAVKDAYVQYRKGLIAK
ncbi:MAG TPA: VacJ family lipoprotein [Verrucomicrobiae bacterium]|nr:VacJ family lipoprotein [Verrucomicrobiae bacterium]